MTTGIEKIQKEIESIKSKSGESDIDDLKKILLEIQGTEEKRSIEKAKLNYEGYFNSNIQAIIDTMSISGRRSNNLLVTGIVVILIGILVYLAMIFFWLDEFHTNGFQTYHIFGVVSTSLLFLFIEFLGAWFLKQHRRVSEEKLYLMKFKATIERTFQAYLLAKESNQENQLELHKTLLDLFKTDLNFPSSNEVEYSSFAKEAMGTISNLTDSIKKLTQK